CIVDLTGIGQATPEQWYFSFLNNIRQALDLNFSEEELKYWWEERIPFSPLQNFIGFWRDLALPETSKKIVVFVDEIDAIQGVLDSNFTADFLGGVRACFNLRADEPVFERLTFVLLGVAEPNELINDPKKTPFNIGSRLELLNFSRTEVEQFAKGLEDSGLRNSLDLVYRIYHWTHGQPYLTQLLCHHLATNSDLSWDSKKVDQLIDNLFLEPEGDEDINIKTVRSSVEKSDRKDSLLRVFSRLQKERKIQYNAENTSHTSLKLFGLIDTQQGNLNISNRIYKHIFDLNWARNNMSFWGRNRLILSIALICLLLLAVLGSWLAYEYFNSPNPVTTIAFNPTITETLKEEVEQPISITPNHTPTPVPTDPQLIILTTSTATEIVNTITPALTDTPTLESSPVTESPTSTETATPTEIPIDQPTLITSRLFHEPIINNLSCEGESIVNFSSADRIRFQWTWRGQLFKDEYLEVRIGPKGGILTSYGRVFDGQYDDQNPLVWQWHIVPQSNFLDGINSDYQWQVVHMAADEETPLAFSDRGCFKVSN
ncbi:MAG: AAA-like domain-containing protein, partial [Bacteroidota bacterium]